jgi:hypothetical protein
MAFIFHSLAYCSIFLTGAWSLSTVPQSDHQVQSTATPLLPTKDPFYTAPPLFELKRPGEILRIRSAPGNLTSIVSNTSAIYNILYRTTDSHNEPSFAVTTLFIPMLSTNGHCDILNEGASLLSYQVEYDTPDLNDSPSFALSTLYTTNIPDFEAALGRCWYVNMPDYEGPKASFTAGVQSGYATIDSVRAVLGAGLGLHSHTRSALWGYSGGSIATEYAAELQQKYAPDLTLNGVAVGGLIPNIETTVRTVTGTTTAGLIPLGTIGLSRQYPGLLDYFKRNLKSTGQFNATTYLAAANMSVGEAFEIFAGQNIFSYFSDGIDVLQGELLQEAFQRDGIMGVHGVPRMALFAYQAISDEVSPIQETDALVKRYCDLGANILYQRNTVGDHFSEQTNGDARAVEFLISVLEGPRDDTSSAPKLSRGCTIQNVTIG